MTREELLQIAKPILFNTDGVYLSPQRNEVLAWTMIPNVWEGEQNG
jgi:hypothetical protein